MHLTRHLLLFLLFCSTQRSSQAQLNYGKVLNNKKFSCSDYRIQMEATTNSPHTTGLQTICESKNEFEIRFYVPHRPSSEWDLFVLSYDSGVWNATKYLYDFGRISFDTAHPIKIFKLKPKYGFDTLFMNLKENNVFTLPDQQKLKYKGDVDDGNIYFLSYKVKNKFRRYSFENTETYREENKGMKEFENYDNIATIFYEDLEKK
jgi:hypothetical protein